MNIDRLLLHTAVYWGNPTSNGYGGYTYDDPVELPVRWLDKQEKFLGKTKDVSTYTEYISRAKIILGQDVDLGGMIALTDLASLSSSEAPEDNDAWEIKAITKVPDIKVLNYIRKAFV